MSKYQTFTPGKYFDWEKKVIEERLEKAQKGLAKPRGEPTEPLSSFEILQFNRIWEPYNPLFNDKKYAKKAGYPDVPAFPGFLTYIGEFTGVTIPMDMGDEWQYAHGPNDLEFFAPIFPGDSLTTETDKLLIEEITVPGSELRKFRNGCIASVYNQKGDLVVKSKIWRREAYKKIIDGSPKKSFAEVHSEWVKALPPTHYTTDGEWDYILELWEKEQIRGSKPLYWEDVKVGDEPAWVTSGPVSYLDLVRWQGGGGHGYDMKPRNPEGPLGFGGWHSRNYMFRDIYGQYFDLTALHYGGRNIPGTRALFYNDTAAKIITRLVTNYIGDAGFVTRVAWMFQQFNPVMRYEREGGEYLDKVPYMKGKACTDHPAEGDTVIGKGYVTDKYVNDKGNHIIDLVCWGETLDKKIIEVVPISAKLPSKKK